MVSILLREGTPMYKKIQRSFTKHITCMNDMPYHERLKSLRLYYHVNVGRVRTLAYNSFRWRSIRPFTSLPMYLHSISACSVLRFKTQQLFVCCVLVLLLDSSQSSTPILGTLWIFPAGLESIIVWMARIAYMVVTMRMTWRPIRCSQT